MTIHEAVKNIKALKDDSMDGVVQKLEAIFGVLPDSLKEFINMKPEHYTTNKRIPLIKLNKSSVLNFKYNFDYDMLGNGMIPLFDVFDANYIVYRVKESDYCFFSVTSEMPSGVTKDIFTLLGENF